MNDPLWLQIARAEGRVISDSHVADASPGLGSVHLVPNTAERSSSPPALSRLTLTVTISPLRLPSEANRGGKLKDKIHRKNGVKAAVKASLPMLCFPLPAVVTMTRLGGKRLDDDNLRRALKAVRDVVAEWLGVDDADPKVCWRCRQRPAWRMGCRIWISEEGG